VILSCFGDADAAAAALAEQVAGSLRAGLASRGAATLAVPGGSTPLPLFHALRNADLQWSRVGVTLTDERWVPDNDAASNGALVRRELLEARAQSARFVSWFDGSASAAAAAPAVWRTLRQLARPFDAVVLGMGEDGHFASLFAGNAGLPHALDMRAEAGCVAMRAPVAPFERLSLNLAALTQSQRLFLLISGSAKRELLLQAARRHPDDSRPVAALLALRHPLPEVYWSP
jgi:6-phosphogluconolactonase